MRHRNGRGQQAPDGQRVMAKQNRKWRHHFVPEMLLKRFTDEKGLLHYIDRVGNVRRPANIPRNLGYHRDFYFLEDKENGNVVEDAFAKLEAKASPIIDKVIETRSVPNDKDDWLTLMNCVAMQAVRVPSTKHVIARPIHREREIIADMIRHDPRLYKRNVHMIGIDSETVPYDEFLAMTDEEVIAPLSNDEFFLYSMSMAKPVLESINQRLWTVVNSDKPGEHFVVSDDPVVLYWSDGIHRRLPPGYGHQNADVTFPLSSEVALILTYPEFKIRGDGVRHQVARTNSKTISGSNQFVAARDESFICYTRDGIVKLSALTRPPAIPPLTI